MKRLSIFALSLFLVLKVILNGFAPRSHKVQPAH